MGCASSCVQCHMKVTPEEEYGEIDTDPTTFKDMTSEIEEFRQYHKSGGQDPHVEAKHLSKLADHYAMSANWRRLIQAYGLYYACFVRTNDIKYKELAHEIMLKYSRLAKITQPRDTDINKFTDLVSKFLKQTRESVTDRLDEIQKLIIPNMKTNPESLSSEMNREAITQFCDIMSRLTSDCNRRTHELAQLVTEKAVTITGEPPCPFAACLLGPPGKGGGTAYTGLQFLYILQDPEMKSYFETLDGITHMLIISQGETNLNCLSIEELDWFNDKTITGLRVTGFQSQAHNELNANIFNKFIKSVDELIEICKEVSYNPSIGETEKEYMHDLLTNSVVFYGERKLHEHLKKALSGLEREKASRDATMKDIEKFSLATDDMLNPIHRAKTAFSRYPSIILYDFKIMHNCQATETGELIHELHRKAVISATVAECLRFLVNADQFIHHIADSQTGSQLDNVSYLLQSEGLVSIDNHRFFPQPLMYNLIFETVLFKNHISQSEDKIVAFSRDMQTDVKLSHAAVAEFYMRDYKRCIEYLNEHYSGLNLLPVLERLLCVFALNELRRHSEAFELLNTIDRPTCNYSELTTVNMYKGMILKDLHRYDEALDAYNDALPLCMSPVSRALTYHCIGDIYIHKCEYDQAKKWYMSSLGLREEVNPSDRLSIADTYTCLGIVHANMSCYKEAESNFSHSITEYEAIFSKQITHLSVANAMVNLASVYDELSRYNDAENLYIKALSMYHLIYGPDTPHMEVASAMMNLAVVYNEQSKYEASIELYNKSLTMFYMIYGQEAQCHEHVGQVMMNLANVYKNQDKFDTAVELYRKSLSVYQRLYGLEKPHVEVAQVMMNLADVYREQTKYEEALVLYNRSLYIYHKLFGTDAPNVSIAYVLSNLAVLFTNQSKYDAAIELFNRSLSIYNQLFGPDVPNVGVANVYMNMAVLYAEQAKYEAALVLYKKAIFMYQKLFGNDSPHRRVADIMLNLANVYRDQSKYDVATDFYNKSLSMYLHLYGPETPHMTVARVMINLANVYHYQAHYESAAELYKKSLSIYYHLLGADTPHEDIGCILMNLANGYTEQQKYDAAEELYNKSLSMFRLLYGPETPNDRIALVMLNLGNVYKSLCKYEEALELYNKSLSMYRQLHGPNAVNDRIADVMMNLAVINDEMSNNHAAEEFYNNALTMYLQLYGPDAPHVSVALAYNNLGTCYYDQGKLDLAVEFLTRAVTTYESVFGKGSDHPSLELSRKGLSVANERLKASTVTSLE